jgi:hypothetical protein
MQPDPEFLRQHYAAMSDEELQSIDRADLVKVAQQIYDEEVATRESSLPPPSESATAVYQEEIEIPDDWLEDAAEAYSRYVVRGTAPAPEAVHARDVLEAAGIPCELELFEDPDQDEQMQHRWRVLVPGKLVHRALSVIDRDIFNAEFEAEWSAHLEMLSDEELQVMAPEYAFCGLYDRLARIKRAYDQERHRRRMDG